jgi:uncharacterized protein (TIGR00730 family)
MASFALAANTGRGPSMIEPAGPPRPSLLEEALGAESRFLSRKNGNGHDRDSAIRIFLEFLRAFESFQLDRPVVTFFGSARISEGHAYYDMARRTARRLGESGFAIMTGGGPGLMEAANRGAREAGAPSYGCNIELPQEQEPNRYVDHVVTLHHFFVRKVMLMRYSCAFVLMPGGYGTLDEMLEALVLMQTGKLERFPVVSMGASFWNSLRGFLKDSLLESRTIDYDDLDLWGVTDDPADAVAVIVKACIDRGIRPADGTWPRLA